MGAAKRLDQKAISSFRIQDETRKYLEKVFGESGREKEDFRILDYGCGIGRAVAVLRQEGYSVYGSEISQIALECGRPYFDDLGCNGADILRQIELSGNAGFPDEYFHFAFSNQVFEHVKDIDVAAKELSRITAPGGFGLHLYPAHLSLVEGHVIMPIVHWFPKNPMRKPLIRTCISLGIEQRNDWLKNLDPWARTQGYYDYLDKKTWYRSPRAFRSAFEANGFEVRFASGDHSGLRRLGKAQSLLRIPLAKGLVNWALCNFVTVVALTKKI